MLLIWNKIFLQRFTGIYWPMLWKCFPNAVLVRLEMVHCKCFFLKATRNMFAGRLVRFLTMLLNYIFNNVFWTKLFCKMSDLFASICWLWDFLPKNLKLVNKLKIWCLESFIFWCKFRFFVTVLGHFSHIILNFLLSANHSW